MKRFWIVLVSCMALAGSASAQFPPGPGGMTSPPPGYGGPGSMPAPGMMGGQMPPGYGGPGMTSPEMMGGQQCPSPEIEMKRRAFGWHPGLKFLFSKKERDHVHHLHALKAATPPPDMAQGGTLAFPHHQFVRSPRDFFMEDK